MGCEECEVNHKVTLLEFQHLVTRPTVFTVNLIMSRLSFSIPIFPQMAAREICMTGNELQFAVRRRLS